jgi:DNA invertase Pin-like site-specific DNA recombinase
MFQTLGLFSEFERSIIRNRVEAGLARRRRCAAPASRIKAMMKRTA